jgi:hypothetical protein
VVGTDPSCFGGFGFKYPKVDLRNVPVKHQFITQYTLNSIYITSTDIKNTGVKKNLQETEENYRIRNIMICNPCQILFELKIGEETNA